MDLTGIPDYENFATGPPADGYRGFPRTGGLMKAQPLTVYLPDTRGVTISPYGKGNLKIGMGVYTYSRVAGSPLGTMLGTCPGSTAWCETHCYAKRIEGTVRETYIRNSYNSEVPPIPADARLLRIHVSGDFDTVRYISQWVDRLRERPDVRAWGYTRSWRVASLLPALEVLRALPNMQLFASTDVDTEAPPRGWRAAWIDGDMRCEARLGPEHRLADPLWPDGATLVGRVGYVCPEETGRRRDCEQCRYCFDGQKHDVVFLEH